MEGILDGQFIAAIVAFSVLVGLPIVALIFTMNRQAREAGEQHGIISERLRGLKEEVHGVRDYAEDRFGKLYEKVDAVGDRVAKMEGRMNGRGG